MTAFEGPFFCAFLCLFAAINSGCAKREVTSPAEKILRLSQRNEPGTLDPQLATLPDDFFIIRALGEGLLMPNPDGGAPLPGVAERYDISADGLTYTFHLRADAQWSDGKPVISANFAAMIRRATAPDSLTPKAHLFAAVRDVQTPNPRTLAITLKQPTADFPSIVASGSWIPARPDAGLDKTSNGPFTLGEWKPNQHLTVHKNSHYWDAANVKLDRIDFVAFDSGDTEERAFRAGQVDVTMSAPASKLAGYRAAQPPVLRTVPLHELRYLALNVQRPPLNDARVRRALALALDRTALVEKVLLSGSPAFNFVPAGLGGYTPSAQIKEDAAQARALLAAAGFPGGEGFPRLELASWPVNTAQLEAIQQMWHRELGIEVTLARREASLHLASMAAGDYASPS